MDTSFICGPTAADTRSLQTNRRASLSLNERCADILISIRCEIADAGCIVTEELCATIAKLVEYVPATLLHTHAFHLICTPHRSFGEVRYFFNKLGQRPFFKRYPNRDETLSSISGCDISLNDALGMFGVRVVFHSERAALCNRLTRSSALIALHPDPYSEAHPSQRAAATERNARSSRILLARLSKPFISLLMAVTQGRQLGTRRQRPPSRQHRMYLPSAQRQFMSSNGTRCNFRKTHTGSCIL